MNMGFGMSVLACAWFFGLGFVAGLPYKDERAYSEQAKQVIEECQKDLPRSQVCELSAKVKEGKND